MSMKVSRIKYSVAVILLSIVMSAFTIAYVLSSSAIVTSEGSIVTGKEIKTLESQNDAFESGLNYLSASNRFYENDSLVKTDFENFTRYNITNLSIRLIWASWADNNTESFNNKTVHENVISNFHRLLNLTDIYDFSVQFDFWTSFAEGGNWTTPPGVNCSDIIHNDTVKQQWLDFVGNATTEFGNHTSIKSWTMMNEPYVKNGTNDEELFYDCWTKQRSRMRNADNKSRNLSIRFALGHSPWSGDFNRTEVFQLCDYIAINEYLDPANASYNPWYSTWTMFNQCILDCQNHSIPLVISEFGMNTNTLEDRGRYYKQSLNLFICKGIQKAYAWAWQTKNPENESYNICDADPANNPTPAFRALAAASGTKHILGDLNNDGEVNIMDLVMVAVAYGSSLPSDPKYKPIADINSDDNVNIMDIVVIAIHYGETD